MKRLFLILAGAVSVLAPGVVVSAREPDSAQSLKPVSAFHIRAWLQAGAACPAARRANRKEAVT